MTAEGRRRRWLPHCSRGHAVWARRSRGAADARPTSRPAQVSAGGAGAPSARVPRDQAPVRPTDGTPSTSAAWARGKNYSDLSPAGYGYEGGQEDPGPLPRRQEEGGRGAGPDGWLEAGNFVRPGATIRRRGVRRGGRDHMSVGLATADPAATIARSGSGCPDARDDPIRARAGARNFRQTVRSFLEKVVPHHAQWRPTARSATTSGAPQVSRACCASTHRRGSTAAPGSGLPLAWWSRRMCRSRRERQGLIHTDIIVPYISQLGTAEQKRWLPGLVSGSA